MAAPTFVSSSPLNGATDVAKNASILVTFSEALDPASVDAQSVYLKSTELGTIVSAAVSLSSDALAIRVVPGTILIPLSSYKLTIVGTDVNATDHVKSATGDSLVSTVNITFQTSDTVEDGDIGDLILPDDITTVAGASTPLRVMAADPKHHSFGLPIDIEKIRIRFNKDLDSDSIASNVTMRQTAFYEEEALRAVEVDIGEGLKHYFQMDTVDYTGGDTHFLDPDLFADAPGYAATTGAYLEWIFTGESQKNVCFELELGADIADTEGLTLGSTSIWFGCTEPYPDWVGLRSVRHQIGHNAAAHIPDDFIGMKIWQNSMDLVQQMSWRISLDEASIYYKKLVRCITALQLWEDLKVTAALAAGTTKRLGDLTIQYAATAGAVRPWAINRLNEECEELKRQTLGALSEKIATGIRSARDGWEPSRAFFRARLWRAELIYNGVVTPATVANTAKQRLQGTWM